MPNVYTYFDSSPSADPNQATILRLWVRSWEARGWKPKILTVQNASRHPQYEKLKADPRELPRLAAESVGVKWITPWHAINFSFKPRDFKKFGSPKIIHFHSAGWESSAVVDFPNVHDPDVIEHCGRPL